MSYLICNGIINTCIKQGFLVVTCHKFFQASRLSFPIHLSKKSIHSEFISKIIFLELLQSDNRHIILFYLRVKEEVDTSPSQQAMSSILVPDCFELPKINIKSWLRRSQKVILISVSYDLRVSFDSPKDLWQGLDSRIKCLTNIKFDFLSDGLGEGSSKRMACKLHLVFRV